MQHVLERAKHRLTRSAQHYVFREPSNAVARYRERMDTVDQRMRRELRGSMQSAQQSLDWVSSTLQQRSRSAMQAGRQGLETSSRHMEQALRLRQQRATQEVQRLTLQLRALNPLAVLQRGYSVTRLDDGTILRDASAVRAGDHVRTRLAKGEVLARVVEGKEKG